MSKKSRLIGSLLLIVSTRSAGAVESPPDFIVEDAFPGATFQLPTSMTFTPGGRAFVAEKRGVVYIVENGVKLPVPLWDGRDEVLDNGDRGLLAVTVAPNFPANGYVYLLYTVDPDSDGVDTNETAFGRLTRYTISTSDSNALDPASRTVLMGTSFHDGPASASRSHTIGSLRWGTDGSLLISTGDGAFYSQVDAGGMNPDLFLPGRAESSEDIGSFRARSLTSLAGKILRIDPETGSGYASNPFYDGNLGSTPSRVWAYGLRNPFRFCVRPGSGLYDPEYGRPGVLSIGDVGWNNFEELDLAADAGADFGWPCMEGTSWRGDNAAAAPPGFDCEPGTAPQVTYHHSDPTRGTPPGTIGSSVIGGIFYAGASYPPPYQGALFFGDFGESWIKVARLDESHQLAQVTDFAIDADGPVDFAADPASGDIHFVAIYSGTIRRIRYTGMAGNQAPLAAASASILEGAAPLAVTFSSASSVDPESNPITYTWSFNDGTSSTNASPVHVFSNPGTYRVVLTAMDVYGALDRDTLVVHATSADHFPTTPVIDDFTHAGPLEYPWLGLTKGLTVVGGDLTLIGLDGWAEWDHQEFAADQEAWIGIGQLSPDAPEHNLLLKLQGESWIEGCIEVRYDDSTQAIRVSTFTPGIGWELRGAALSATLHDGDQLGARARADGIVEIFVNGLRIGTRSCQGWQFATSSGHVGFMIVQAPDSRIRYFGGGDHLESVNQAPHAHIVSPTPAFFATGDTLELLGLGLDSHESPEALSYHWIVDRVFADHVDAAIAGGDGPSFELAIASDDSASGFRARLIATDAGGLADTTVTAIHPEVDFAASPVVVSPDTLNAYTITSSGVTYTFTLRNRGRMDAPSAHWRLIANQIVLAQGTADLGPLETRPMTVVLPLNLANGAYLLRLEVDMAGEVPETDEANNASQRVLYVMTRDPANVDVTPGNEVLALSNAYPNPMRQRATLALSLPRDAHVSFTIHDVQGRTLWSREEGRAAGRWTLEWDGRDQGGSMAGPGVYFATVAVEGARFTRRITVVR